MRVLIRLIAVLIVLFILCVGIWISARDWLMKTILESVIHRFTGFSTNVESFKLSPKEGVIEIKGLALLDPYEFQARILADIPLIWVHIDLPALLKEKKIHLSELVLNVREFNVEKNEKGISNISLLSAKAKPAGEKKTTAGETSPAPKPDKTAFRLDRLNLTIGRVSYWDRSSVVPEKVSLDMKIHQEIIENIIDPKAITNIILYRIVSRSPLSNLGLDPATLEKRVNQTSGKVFALGDVVFSDAPNAVTGEVNKVVNATEKKAENEVKKIFNHLHPRPKKAEATTSNANVSS